MAEPGRHPLRFERITSSPASSRWATSSTATSTPTTHGWTSSTGPSGRLRLGLPGQPPRIHPRRLRRVQPAGLRDPRSLHQVPEAALQRRPRPAGLPQGGLNIEFEERHVLPFLDQPGRCASACSRIEGNSADYRDVVTLTQLGAFGDINDAVNRHPPPPRKSGGYINLEQALTPELGMFARASLGDGRTENISFTDIDQSFSGGLSLKGKGLGPARRHDRRGRGDERPLPLSPGRLRQRLLRPADRRRGSSATAPSGRSRPIMP